MCLYLVCVVYVCGFDLRPHCRVDVAAWDGGLRQCQGWWVLLTHTEAIPRDASIFVRCMWEVHELPALSGTGTA